MRAALRDRLGRLAPERLAAPYLTLAIGCWLLTAALAVVILVPGLTDGATASQTGSSGFIGVFTAPLGLRLLLVGAGVVVVAVTVVGLLLRERERPDGARRAALEVGVAVAGGFPALALLADRQWMSAAAAGVLFAAAEVAVHRGPRTAAQQTIVGAIAATTWLVLFVAQFGPAAEGASWTWIALFGAAVAFAAFGSYYGVARAAESRTALLRPLFRDDRPFPVVAAVVLLVAVLTVLRLTVARDLFAEPDPRLWSPFAAPPVTWLHGLAVAALVVVVAVRSVRRPLRRTLARRVTAGLAIAGNADLALAVAVILLGMIAAAATGETLLPDVPPVLIAALKLLGVVVVTAVALLPAFRGTTARALALVTGAYLVPLTLQGLLTRAGLLDGEFAATPVQVAGPLIALAVVAVAVPPLRATLGAGLTVRLAVVPFVAVHAGWLLPAAWTDLGRIVLVVGVLLAILLFLPPLAADPDRHALQVLTASGGQLLALAVFVLALPGFVGDGAIVVLGLFWLAVAVIAALIVRTQPGADDVETA